MQYEALTHRIIGCALRVRDRLCPGYFESVYEVALAYELERAGLRVARQVAIKVCYDDIVVGDFIAEMVVEECVLVENKAVCRLTAVHEVQLVNYLTSTGIDV